MSKLIIKFWEDEVHRFEMDDSDYVILGDDGKHITVWRNTTAQGSFPIAGFSGWIWWMIADDE